MGDSYCQIPWVKVTWRARISYPTVDTPVYKGPALLNGEYECAQPIDLSEINNPLKCAHELWYFAPNIGLVEIAPEWVALPCDPNCRLELRFHRIPQPFEESIRVPFTSPIAIRLIPRTIGYILEPPRFPECNFPGHC